jgi:predicted nucleic acid-binding protein
MTTAYYLDASALVKRYVTEVGTSWIRDLVIPAAANLLLTSRVTIVEIRSALARRRREGNVSAEEHTFVIEALRAHSLAQYRLVEFDASVADLAGDLLECYPLRAYDAVQLASALTIARVVADVHLPAPRFLTADDRLLEIAEAEGLPTDNPNRHL